MNRVVQFDERTMVGERKLNRLLVEFDDRGCVIRELGIGKDGVIAHRWPGGPYIDKYGLMGPNVIAITGENPSRSAILMDPTDLVPLERFEEMWSG